MPRPVFSILLSFVFLVSTCASAQAQAASNDEIYVTYISGGGLAQFKDIQKRIKEIKNLYKKSGKKVNVKAFTPGWGTPMLHLPLGVLFYSAFNAVAITSYLIQHEGKNLHIIGSSLGAGIIRDAIIPTILFFKQSFQIGSMTLIEAMSPFSMVQHHSVSDKLKIDSAYISIETEYTGPFADYFKKLTKAGPLVPDSCSTGATNCFFIKGWNSAEINTLLDVVAVGMKAHALNVTSGENAGQQFPLQFINAQSAPDPAAAKQAVLDKLQEYGDSAPLPPVPPNSDEDLPLARGNVIPPIITGGGGGGASGGGVGVESYPTWVSLKDYLDQQGKLGIKRNNRSREIQNIKE